MAYPADDMSRGRRRAARRTFAAALSQFDSVRLFLDRAQHVRPGFTVDDGNAPASRRSAAASMAYRSRESSSPPARCRSMTPAEILDGLTDVFRLLTGRPVVLPRQATLEASITWSHDLLSEPERVLFRRLAGVRGRLHARGRRGGCAATTTACRR